MQGIALTVEVRGEFAIADACADSYCVRLVVDGHLVEMFERDLAGIAVGDGVEGMARAESAQLVAAFDCFLNFVDGTGREEIVGGIGEIAGPVRARSCGLIGFSGNESGQGGSTE